MLLQPIGTFNFTLAFAVQTNFEQAASVNQTEYFRLTTPGPGIGPASATNVTFQLDRSSGIPPHNGSNTNSTVTSAGAGKEGGTCTCLGIAPKGKIAMNATCPQDCNLHLTLCELGGEI